MRFKYCLTILIILSFAAFSGLSTTGSVYGWQANDVAEDQDIFRIYALQHARADQAQEIIGNMIVGKSDARLMVDQRTNSLIVSGSPEDHQVVADLITSLDTQKRDFVQQTPPAQLTSVPLGGLDPDLVRSVLDTTLAGRQGVRLQVVDDLGTIILSGSKNDVDTVKTVLKTIGESSQKTAEVSSVYVSMTFIVDGGQVEDKTNFGRLESHIAKVLADADVAGLVSFEEPVVACKTVNRVRVEPGTSIHRQKQEGRAPSFENKSESGGKNYAMSNSGYIAQTNPTTFQIETNISLQVQSEMAKLHANTPMAEQLEGSTQLSAEMEIPIDHPVLLSFSTILGVDSVVIVHVQKAK